MRLFSKRLLGVKLAEILKLNYFSRRLSNDAAIKLMQIFDGNKEVWSRLISPEMTKRIY